MANLLSQGTAFAGLYGPCAVLTASGPVPPASLPLSVTVHQSDGTTVATLWENPTKVVAVANPVNTDAYGNLTFFADPGVYVLSYTLAGIATTKTVQVDPFFGDAAWNVVVDSVYADPQPGDCRLTDASAQAAIENLPISPYLGSRFRFVKTDSSTNTVTVTTPNGVILGLGGFSVTSIVLGQQGSAVELFSDGTNYHVVSSNVGVGVDNVNVVAASGATYTFSSVGIAGAYQITLSANCTFTMPAAINASSFYASIQQAATGGPFTATWSGVGWPGSVAPTMTTTASLWDLYQFVCMDSGWRGVVVGQGYA